MRNLSKRNIFYVPVNGVTIPDNGSDKVADQFFDALEEIPFNKISIPIYAYKSTLHELADGEKNSNITVGYIKKYNAEKRVFKVFIFDKFIDDIKKIIKEAEADCKFNTYKGDLTTITKINIEVSDDEESTDEESSNTFSEDDHGNSCSPM